MAILAEFSENWHISELLFSITHRFLLNMYSSSIIHISIDITHTFIFNDMNSTPCYSSLSCILLQYRQDYCVILLFLQDLLFLYMIVQCATLWTCHLRPHINYGELSLCVFSAKLLHMTVIYSLFIQKETMSIILFAQEECPITG